MPTEFVEIRRELASIEKQIGLPHVFPTSLQQVYTRLVWIFERFFEVIEDNEQERYLQLSKKAILRRYVVRKKEQIKDYRKDYDKRNRKELNDYHRNYRRKKQQKELTTNAQPVATGSQIQLF